MSTQTAESVVLFYKDGGSDKVYQLQLEPKGKGWVVNFQYGRRGDTLKPGTKTEEPLEYEKAKKVYAAAIKIKTSKGYTPDTSGKMFAMTSDEAKVTGLAPQLLNSIDEETLEQCIKDPTWMMQQKHDGKRMMLRKIGGKIEAINRRGLTCGFPEKVQDSLSHLPKSFLLDGEMVGETYFVFDLLEYDGYSCREEGALLRWNRIADLFDKLIDPDPNVTIVHTAIEVKEKRRLLKAVKDGNYEGVVFKKIDSPYRPGRPNSKGNQLKYKFTETVTCQVVSRTPGKRSVELELMDDGGGWESVGSVTIPPNHDVPGPLDIVEVRYLYAYPNGCLYQPVYLGLRDDQTAKDCKLSQLKYKAGTEEEE